MATVKKNPATPSEAQGTMPFRRVLSWTMGAGGVLALGGFVTGHAGFAVGALVGAGLSCAGLLHVKAALRKTLSHPEKSSPASYLATSALRILVWAVALFLLLKVSLACMLAAALVFTLHLGILAFLGWQTAPEAKSPEMPPPIDEDR